MSKHRFKEAERLAVYKAIYERRDMRHFIPNKSIDSDVLSRLLKAAHAAPSVGYMQPWRFLRVTDPLLRDDLYGLVEEERINTAKALNEREDEFMKLKIEGVLDCSEIIVVALSDQREKHIFGRRTMPQMDLASASCAIQNLWLAARAEGLGMGWVSIFDPEKIKSLLEMPDDSEAIAILCLGHVKQFYPEPMLAMEKWAEKIELEQLIMENRWDKP